MSYNSDYNTMFAKTLKLFPYKKDNGDANPNSQQIEIIKRVLALGPSGSIIINASTGSGKTAASLSSMMARADFSKQKIFVFVRTITQMNPIIREWARIIGGYDGLSVPNVPKILPIKGKNKLCKMVPIMRDHGKISPEALGLLCKTMPCQLWPGNPNRVKNHKSPKYVIEVLNRKLAAIATSSKRSPIDAADEVYTKMPGCGYFVQNELMRYAKIIVATYAHLNDGQFTRLVRMAASETHRLLVLIDEAHNLSRLNETILRREDLECVINLVGKSALFDKLGRIIKLQGKFDADGIAPYYEWELARQLLSGDEDYLTALGISKWDLLIPEVVRLNSFIAVREQGKISARNNELRILEVTPAKKLAKLKETDLLVFQSGTINIRESKQYFNMPEAQGLDTEPAIKDNRFKCYLVSRGLTSKATKRSPTLYKNMARTIVEFHQHSPRHTLVVCPSYVFKKELLEHLLEIVDEDEIVNETKTSSMKDLTDDIKYANNSRLIVAVSGGKITEGVEMVRDGLSLISLVLMAGISFRPRRDDEILVTKEIVKVTKNPYRVDPQKLKITQEIDQAFGRAVRASTDRGMLIILDYRAKKYDRDLKLKSFASVSILKNKMISFFDGYTPLDSLG